ncbi:helix-turn-helix transcriptional regulator [Brevibacterium samyangense]|uniref:HTH cro/C1-type domain-containing protein n=1 Tax=Brevibacterium samyangense TaxID=366888 RepID=A0ABN2T5D9_9MICO
MVPRTSSTTLSPDEGADEVRVQCHLDELLEARGMTLTELSQTVGISLANLSVLKNNRAKAVRFSTLVALCDTLGCQPGDLFTVTGESV